MTERGAAVVLLALACSACTREEPARGAAIEPPAETREAPPPSAAPAPAPPPCAKLDPQLPELSHFEGEAPLRGIEHGPKGRAELLPFFDHVAELLRGTAKSPVRVVVYGDSNGTRDFMTGKMRRVLQLAHGDAGHGYVTFGRPWRWHDFMDVKVDAQPDTWGALTVTSHPAPDHFHGHALIAAHSLQNGAKLWAETAGPDAPVGRSAGRFEIAYMKGPRFGKFEVLVDGEGKAMAEGYQEKIEVGFVEVRVPDGPHKMTVVTRSQMPVRILGAAIERDRPGFVVDGVGVGMLNCETMLRDDAAVFQATMARRNYDLVIFHLGTLANPARYESCQREVTARIRAALPGVPILIMSPPDFLEDDYVPPKTPPWVAKVRDEQRAFARANDLAFYDFFEAMGGENSMRRFEAQGMTIRDGVHFNEKGGAYMGERVVHALLADLREYLAEAPRAGCTP